MNRRTLLAILLSSVCAVAPASAQSFISVSKQSLISLSTFVGFTPANFNMLPWRAFAQATDFSQNYTLDGATIVSGVAAPNRLVNGQKLVESSGAGNHRVYEFDAVKCETSSQCVFRVAVIAQQSGRTRIVVFSETYLHETNISASVGFDLAGGNVGYDVVAGTETIVIAQTITPIGGGLYLCMFDYQYTGSYLGGSCVMQPKIYLDNGSGTAARSINYTGNGTSGVNLWWFSLMPKGAWSITSSTPVFSDDFTSLSTIDLADTLNPSFKWFIRNYAPNSINPAWWDQSVLPPSLPGNFSISAPSVLAINSGGSNWQSMVYSVGFPNAGGYVGQAWQPPVLFDGYMSWDNSIHKTAAFWGHAVEAMAGTIGPTAHWLEYDGIDVGCTRSSVNDEYMSAGTPTVINRSDAAGWIGKSMALGDFHRLSSLWLSIASNDNSFGIFMSFFDGQYVSYSDVAYNAIENQPPIVDVNQALLASFEALHMPIMLNIQNSGPNSGGPMLIDWVRVYTP